LLATLDEHSFPSGHAMTLSAVLAPIVILWPSMTISGVLMAACLAWSRVATVAYPVASGSSICSGLAGLAA
jgi:undecaprenyl-diphosphatase